MIFLCEEVRKTKDVISKSQLRVKRKGKSRATMEIMIEMSKEIVFFFNNQHFDSG